MTDWEGRTLELSLDFLGDGYYQALNIADESMADSNPKSVSISDMTVTANDSLTVIMAPGGGYVSYLKPVEK